MGGLSCHMDRHNGFCILIDPALNVFRIKRPGGPKDPNTNAVFAAWSPPSGPSFHDAGAFRPFVFEARP